MKLLSHTKYHPVRQPRYHLKFLEWYRRRMTPDDIRLISLLEYNRRLAAKRDSRLRLFIRGPVDHFMLVKYARFIAETQFGQGEIAIIAPSAAEANAIRRDCGLKTSTIRTSGRNPDDIRGVDFEIALAFGIDRNYRNEAKNRQAVGRLLNNLVSVIGSTRGSIAILQADNGESPLPGHYKPPEAIKEIIQPQLFILIEVTQPQQPLVKAESTVLKGRQPRAGKPPRTKR